MRWRNPSEYSAIETTEAIVEIADADLIEDAELIEDKEYASMGKKPADRVKAFLGKLKASRRGKERGNNPSRELRHTAHKFMRRVHQIFKNLPKPMEWLSFLNNDLPILMDISEEVLEASIQPQLSEKCSIRRSLLYVIRYLTKYHFDFDNSIPARLA